MATNKPEVRVSFEISKSKVTLYLAGGRPTFHKHDCGAMTKDNEYTDYPFENLPFDHHFAFASSLNDIKQDAQTLFLERPYPISEPSAPFPDRFTSIVTQKRKFLEGIQASKRDFKVDRRMVPKHLKDVEYTALPRYFIDICSSKYKDPDIYFPGDCDYNWYYTGGALELLKLHDCECVVTPDAENNLRFTRTNSQTSSVLNTHLNDSDPIFCINQNPVLKDSFLLTVRQKYRASVIFVGFDDENEPCGCLYSKRKSDIPYFDAKLNSSDLATLCTLRADGCLEIVDIEVGKKISEYHHVSDTCSVSSFGQLSYLTANTLIFSDRDQLILTDERFSRVNRSRLKHSPCDDICSFVFNDDYFIYAATKHQLIKYDLRKSEAVGTYAHMLESEPYLISFTRLADTDTICLANKNSKVLIQCDEINASLPLLLPGITDTFDVMQREEKLHLHRHLKCRLSASTIGLRLEKRTEDIASVFSLSASGDVYQQEVCCGYMNNANSERKLSRWIDSLPQDEPRMVLTGVEDMSDAWSALSRPMHESKFKVIVNKVTRGRPLRRYDADNLLGCHLEEPWLTDEIAEDEVVPEVDTSQKVTAWLTAQANEDSEIL